MTMAIAISGRKHRKHGLLRTLGKRVLRVPLIAKLIGANVIIVTVAVAMQTIVFHSETTGQIVMVSSALGAASLVNFLLVRLALKPVADLEVLAERVLSGDFNARSVRSPLADVGLSRLGGTVNGLLDSLAAERKRIQDLGAEVVYAQDEERARVSRELHDSIAQTLAAVRFQLSAASGDAQGDLKNRITAANSLVGSAMEEVKNVSYSLHPRVAEDLGLEAALGTLGRQVEERSGIEVDVIADITGAPVPSNVSATLFRVVQQALRNIEVHSHAKSATVAIMSRDGHITVEISDDGCGFDPSAVPTRGERSGFASVKDRVMLAGGKLKVDSVPNGGTRVTAELETIRAAL